MQNEEQSTRELAEALARLLAFRGQFTTGAMVDPLSKLTTADVDKAIVSLRRQCTVDEQEQAG